MKKKSLSCSFIVVGLLLMSAPSALGDSTAGWWKVSVNLSTGDYVTGDWQTNKTVGRKSLSYLYIFLPTSSSGTAYFVENLGGDYFLENTFSVYTKNRILKLTGPSTLDEADNLASGGTIILRAIGEVDVISMKGFYTRYDNVTEQFVRMGTLVLARVPVQSVPDAVMRLIPGP